VSVTTPQTTTPFSPTTKKTWQYVQTTVKLPLSTFHFSLPTYYVAMVILFTIMMMIMGYGYCHYFSSNVPLNPIAVL